MGTSTTDRTGRTSATPHLRRVLIVAESFLPAVNGVTNSVLRVVEQLERRAIEVVVVAPGPGEDRFGATPVVRVPAVGVPRSAPLRVGLPTNRIASLLRDFRPDLVHVAAPAVLGAAGLHAARRQEIPSVAIYQTDLAGFAKRHGLGPASQQVWRWLRHVHRSADLTLAPSSTAVWALRTHGIERVASWARGVDATRFSPRHRDERFRRRVASSGEVIVGYVGRLAREKQIELLSPMCRLRGVSVVIVGDGPERERLERRLPGAVFTGNLGGLALSRAHASLDVFAHAGIDETFCQSIQESMASAVPVVAPASGGPLDLVRHGATGSLWVPHDPGTFEAAVRELVEAPDRRASMGRAGRAAVVHRSWEAVVDELLDHYGAVLGARTAGPGTIAA